MANLISVIYYIVNKSTELKATIPEAFSAPIEFTCVFTHTERDYKKSLKQISELGKVVENTPTGLTYLLNKPLETISGPLFLVKIRKPDPTRKEVGDADFNTNYKELKKYQNNPKFELIKRETFEMLRFSDANFDVMACFSNIPKSKSLGIEL